jgi:ribosomal-protein-alanine N-acetyltransferase
LLGAGAEALSDGEAFIMVRVAADEAEILTLAVPPLLRRRGRGRALLDAAIVHARMRGARAMFLEVSATNDAARALYAQAGFHETARRTGYYDDGADALVLSRDLA